MTSLFELDWLKR